MAGRAFEIGLELAGDAPAIDFGLHALQCSARQPEVPSDSPAWQNGSVRVRKRQSSKRSKSKKARRPAALKTRGVKRKKDDIFGFMAGKFEIVGDIESPIEDWKYWDPAKNLED
ncbi:MAG: hypothetical protein ACYDCG_14345 [Candidatus Acidiferrales bacterium]